MCYCVDISFWLILLLLFFVRVNKPKDDVCSACKHHYTCVAVTERNITAPLSWLPSQVIMITEPKVEPPTPEMPQREPYASSTFRFIPFPLKDRKLVLSSFLCSLHNEIKTYRELLLMGDHIIN